MVCSAPGAQLAVALDGGAEQQRYGLAEQHTLRAQQRCKDRVRHRQQPLPYPRHLPRSTPR